mgnify:CR=1 FL=1
MFLIFFSFNYQEKSSNLRLLLIDYLKPFSLIFTYPINQVSDVLKKIDYFVELDANSLELKKKVQKKQKVHKKNAGFSCWVLRSEL